MKVKVKMPKGFSSLAAASVKRAAAALAELAKDRITETAQGKLRSTAGQYLKGLTVTASDTAFTIQLKGGLPTMLEAGAPPFDLKKMLRGRKFVDVPFRHAPKGNGPNVMPKSDFNLMRSVAMKARAAGSKTVRGPAKMNSEPELKSNKRFGSYQQKGGKTGSMMKVGVGKSAGYMTFRRMSEKSPASSWIHPGYKALNIFPKVAKELTKLAPKVIAEYIKNGIR